MGARCNMESVMRENANGVIVEAIFLNKVRSINLYSRIDLLYTLSAIISLSDWSGSMSYSIYLFV